MKNLQVVRGDVWRNRDVVAAAKGAGARMFCVAYVTQAQKSLFRSGDRLVCDASTKAVSCGETDPVFLLGLLKAGVEIFSCEALHAKCAVFDDFVLLGSANMSESSANRLVELSVLQKDSRLATAVHAFIDGVVRTANRLSEKDLKKLQTVWRTKQRPWQGTLGKRKANGTRRWQANHVVTVTLNTMPSRRLTQEEIETSERKAGEIVKEEGYSMRGRVLDWYHTSEAWGSNKPKAGDSIIEIEYESHKQNARAKVYGPGTVVMVDRKRKTHIVHYITPDRGIAYGKFRSKFKCGKSMNRYCISDDDFESMANFIRRGGK